MRYRVKRTGRTWSVEDTATGQIVEGGFFARTNAQDCRDRWNEVAAPPEEEDPR